MNKKFYLLGLCVAASAAVANAQQLPNVGFEQWKDACGTTYTLGITGSWSSATRPGIEPSDWNGSSVYQNAIFTEVKKELIKKVEQGYEGLSVSMENGKVGAFGIESNAPGYITLGTPWISTTTDVTKCDGGTYNGIAFDKKPDAIKGYFRRTDTNEEQSHMIVYLWNGTFSSKIGLIDNPSLEQENVDRAILGKDNAGEVTGDGKLVASCDLEFKAASEWELKIVNLEYVENAGEPTMMNIIISAGNYWNRTGLIEGTTLLVDDVDFVYYSTLTALEVNGEPVALVDGKYEYAMSGSALPAVEQVVATTKSQFAKAAVTVDAENAQVRIVVTNQGGKDVDGETSHTYVLQYEKAAEPERYQGYLNIEMGGSNIAENQAATIEITETGEGKCTFVLPDFQFGEASLGDIVVENVTVTENEDGVKTYEGITPEDGDLVLVPNMITASVSLSGTIDASGNCDFDINVLWKEQNLPINVTFTTNEIPAGVEGINGDAVTVYGMAGAVAVSGYSGAIEVYTADGRLVKSVMVDGNAEIALDGGLYIVRAGGEAYKVFVK